jgi:hypothetical protein
MAKVSFFTMQQGLPKTEMRRFFYGGLFFENQSMICF